MRELMRRNTEAFERSSVSMDRQIQAFERFSVSMDRQAEAFDALIDAIANLATEIRRLNGGPAAA